MEMNTVVGRLELTYSSFDLLLRTSDDQRCKFSHMPVMRPFRSLPVIPQHVRKVCFWTMPIEGKPFVRHRQKKNPAETKHFQKATHRTDGILGMLQEMIGNNEVLTTWFTPCQLFSIINYIHLDKVEAC